MRKFNPLCCTVEDSERVVAGYMDGLRKNPCAEFGAAYMHGYCNGWNDKDGVADEYQRDLARKYIAASRSRVQK
jgi:hypothetical protein